MVESNATWGDLIAHRGRLRFVGRQDEQERFRVNFLYDVPAALLFVVQGPAGSGKTALLRQFRRVAREMGAVAVDLRATEVALGGAGAALAAMVQLQGQLEALGMPLATFRERYQEYVRLLERIAHDPAAPAPPWALLGGVQDPDPWAQQAWEAYLDKGFSPRLVALLRDPLTVLTERFVSDLNAWAAVRRIVLTVDDWDLVDPALGRTVVGSGLGQWLMDLLASGVFSNKVSVVLATRTRVTSQLESLQPVTALIQLGPLTPLEATYLSSEEPAGGAAVYPLSFLLGGAASAAELLDALVARYLAELEAEQRTALLTCAVPRAWTWEQLAALGGGIDVPSFQAWLAERPWAGHEGETGRLPRAFREQVLAHVWQHSPDLWRQAHVAWYGLLRGEAGEASRDALCLLAVQERVKRRQAIVYGLAAGEPDAAELALRELVDGLARCLPWALAVSDAWLEAAHAVPQPCELLQSLTPHVVALVRAAVGRDYGAALEALAALREASVWSPELASPELAQRLHDLDQQLRARIPAPPAAAEAELEAAAPEAAPAPATTTPEAVREPAAAEAEKAPHPKAVTAAMREEAAALCRQGDERRRAGVHQAALEAYDRALTLDPACLAAYLGRAQVLLRLGALDRAIADLNRVLALDPTHARALWRRGLAYARQGDLTQAIADYSAALEQDPGLIVARFDRGGAFFRAGDYRRAVEDYTAVVERRPQWPTAYLNRGRVYVEQGRFSEALRDYGKAIALDPERGDLYRYRALALARMERYSDALVDYERALERNPQDAVACNGRGLAYLRIQAYPEAIEAFKRAMALRPDWATPYYNGACAAALQGDRERACLWLGRAIELRPAYRRQALSDADFAVVREAACFKRLVQGPDGTDAAGADAAGADA